MLRRRLISITNVFALLIAVCPLTLRAADAAYPTRPIRIVVASAPGGGLDVTTRIVAPRLSESMGQSWIVDHRSGAAGNVGIEIVARANPDGYTTLAATSTVLTVNPSLYKMPIDTARDLQPITVLSASEQVVVVHPSVSAKSLQELIALARQKPGALNYASAGVGTGIHLGAELLKMRAGIDMTHVSYKGGGPAAAAVLGGEVQVLVGTIASTIAFIQSGRLRALATTGLKRAHSLPDLPTVAESGYPGFEAGLYFALLAPRATPAAIVDRLSVETRKALQQPEVQAAMVRQGLDPAPTTPAELANRIKQETQMWATLVKKAGIRVE